MAYDRRSLTGSASEQGPSTHSLPDMSEQFEQPGGNAAMQEALESQSESGSGEAEGEWEFGPIVGRGRATTGGRSGGGTTDGGRRRVPSGTGTRRG